ncbi:DNA-directed RNA polymerase V subunit 5C isoform X2 [Arachis hypogaea]|uniref:DNA-directed RNA polymerase V subunit 5C isoform X2 n=1 Tax=Arachis hypogaea TaxID=3818 RepID=UPI003B21B7EF
MATNANTTAGECITAFSDNGTVESSRYFHARRTVLEMLRDRGYDVPDSELTRSLAEFRSLYGRIPNAETLRISVSLRSDPSKMVLVVFMGPVDIIKKQTLKSIHDQIPDKGKLNGLLVIVQSKMTSYAKRELMESYPSKVEIFEHVLQPKYEVLTADEKQALLMKHNLEEKQLPLMLKTEAIARYHGWEKGQVVKITHTGGLIHSLVTYRCVV